MSSFPGSTVVLIVPWPLYGFLRTSRLSVQSLQLKRKLPFFELYSDFSLGVLVEMECQVAISAFSQQEITANPFFRRFVEDLLFGIFASMIEEHFVQEFIMVGLFRFFKIGRHISVDADRCSIGIFVYPITFCEDNVSPCWEVWQLEILLGKEPA